MRYHKFSAADRKLVMAETELPEPGPGQVRVRVAAASLNYRDFVMISRFGDGEIDNRIALSDASGTSTRLGTERCASSLGTESLRYSFLIGSQDGSGPATYPHGLACTLRSRSARARRQGAHPGDRWRLGVCAAVRTRRRRSLHRLVIFRRQT